MSERFLEGYLVGTLPALGDPRLAAAVVRKKAKPAQVTDIETTLGEGERKPGKALATRMLDAMAAGKLAELADDAYAILRTSQLVLSAYGTTLGAIEMPFVEGDPNGWPTGVCKALKLPTLARLYGKPTFAWPAKRAAQVEWPIAMQFAAKELAALKAELAKPRDLAALPAALFVDKRYGTDAAVVDLTRDELEHAFAVLAKWIGAAVAKKKSLVLFLDGDQ